MNMPEQSTGFEFVKSSHTLSCNFHSKRWHLQFYFECMHSIAGFSSRCHNIFDVW